MTTLVNDATPSLTRYRKKEADYTARVRDLDAVTSARDAARKEHTDLRKARLDEFMAGFNVITMKLKEMYQVRPRGSPPLGVSLRESFGQGSFFRAGTWGPL